MDFGSLYDAFQAMAKAGLSVEEVMEALEAELAETSPRSSVSRPRFQEYKPGQKRDTGDRGAPGESFKTTALSHDCGRAVVLSYLCSICFSRLSINFP